MSELYPEHQKLKAVKEKAEIVGQFMDWIEEEGYLFARHCDDDNELISCHLPREVTLARFFGINLGKIDAEKRAMLEECRKLHNLS